MVTGQTSSGRRWGAVAIATFVLAAIGLLADVTGLITFFGGSDDPAAPQSVAQPGKTLDSGLRWPTREEIMGCLNERTPEGGWQAVSATYSLPVEQLGTLVTVTVEPSAKTWAFIQTDADCDIVIGKTIPAGQIGQFPVWVGALWAIADPAEAGQFDLNGFGGPGPVCHLNSQKSWTFNDEVTVTYYVHDYR